MGATMTKASFVAFVVRPACAWCEALRQRSHHAWQRFTNPYRPERHYMRGPGPKYRERVARDGGLGE
jgi:hypothetical protein